jgi:hypothetical protein
MSRKNIKLVLEYDLGDFDLEENVLPMNLEAWNQFFLQSDIDFNNLCVVNIKIEEK